MFERFINLEAFQKRFNTYKKMDYANNYYSFWRWKLAVESENDHILDENNLEETHSKLKPILRAWQTYRPFDSSICLQRLKSSLEVIAPLYDEIRKIDLLDFPEASINELKNIWVNLGQVKEKNGEKRKFSDYYVVAVTKPLMFLWGQTLAFDTLVRKRMPNSKYYGTQENRWTFTLWHNIMEEFYKRVIGQPEFIELSQEICRREFGTDSLVPYGQFLDLYYWIGARAEKYPITSARV